MSAWPAADAALRQGWAQGLSASQIGHRIGVTKNAVIGRVRRLGLTPRPSPILPAAVRAAWRPRVTLPMLPFMEEPPKPVVVVPPPPAPAPVVRATSRQCDWPMWGDDEPVPRPPVFCGKPVRWRETQKGWVPCSYCPAHGARAFNPMRLAVTA